MNDLGELFKQIQRHVHEQQEQDEWEELARQQFPGLCRDVFERIQTLFSPLNRLLEDYTDTAVARVWQVEETDERLQIRYKKDTLSFLMIGEDAKQPGDRFTIHIYRQSEGHTENLVGRYILTPVPGSRDLQISVLRNSIPERLDDYHLIELLVAELNKKGGD